VYNSVIGKFYPYDKKIWKFILPSYKKSFFTRTLTLLGQLRGFLAMNGASGFCMMVLYSIHFYDTQLLSTQILNLDGYF